MQMESFVLIWLGIGTQTCIFPFVVVQADIYESIKKCLVDERPRDFADCVSWARVQFQEYYHNTIKQLLFNFPPDQVWFYRLRLSFKELHYDK